ncbi:toll-like receptor 2 [Saccostrea echinata]|uniref:toll-like receptor 2 n=1 Tax=Saccostrea echinata TaxID=191078 RepID=UPI002A83261B|nr:toll-like receptor 2 [Saccostrea echinata]
MFTNRMFCRTFLLISLTYGYFIQLSYSKTRCPKHFCTCTSRTVSCVKHGDRLRYIPTLPENTEVLVFKGNSLPSVTRDTFRNITNLRLRELVLGGNQIKNISSDAFEVFNQLTFLDLSGNQISVSILKDSFHGLRYSRLKKLYLIQMDLPDLPEDMFYHLQNVSTLEGISLNGNSLTKFYGRVFSVLPGLRNIGLNNNYINKTDFEGAHHLKVIRLRYNKLYRVPIFCNSSKSLVPNLRVIDLGQTRISEINRNKLRGICLPRLRNLTLDGNPLQVIPNNTFSDLPSLVRLSIKYLLSNDIVFETTCFNSSSLRLLYIANHMNMFPDVNGPSQPMSDYKNIFRYCRGLQVLDMTKIRLTTYDGVMLYELLHHLTSLTKLILQSTSALTLPGNLFSEMPFLKSLNLQKCLLSRWESWVFENVTSVKTLYLDGNEIAIINKTSFPREFLKNIKRLSLGKNPYLCTCDLMWFRDWLRNNTKVLLLWPFAYQCKSPRNWAGKTLSEFNLSYSECHPLNPYVVAAAAVSAALALVVIIGSVIYYYRWHIKYYIYLMRARKRGYEPLPGEDDFMYDVFVAYHSNDRVWVISELIPCLEKKENLRLCLHDRDFDVGKLIIDNITENIHGSRKVVLLLTNNFVRSRWCTFEMTLAQALDVEGGRSSLVVVMLENIEIQNMCNSLHILLKTTTFLEWPTDKSVRELFWRRLVASVKS